MFVQQAQSNARATGREALCDVLMDFSNLHHLATEKGWAIASNKSGSKGIKANYWLESDGGIWLQSRDKMAALQLDKNGPLQIKLVYPYNTLGSHSCYDLIGSFYCSDICLQ